RTDEESDARPGIDRGVLDAGALSALTDAHRFGPDVVLTPHRGEAERLAARLDLDPQLPGARLAPALARATGATVLLKGAVTLIAPGDGGPLRAQDDATPQLATAGTGDVLAGVLGTLLAAGLSGPDAATGATVLLKGAVTLIAPGDGGPLRAQDDATPQLATAGTGDVLAGVLGTLLAAGLSGPDAATVAAILHGRAGRLASHGGLRPLVALDVAVHLPETIGTILAGARS